MPGRSAPRDELNQSPMIHPQMADPMYQNIQHAHQSSLPQQQQINQQLYSKTIDPYSNKGDSYASIDNAFSKTPSMTEFQRKIATDNPLYPLGPEPPINEQNPLHQSINKNIQNLFDSPNRSSPRDYSNRKNVDKIIESVYSPKAKSPYREISHRNVPKPVSRRMNSRDDQYGYSVSNQSLMNQYDSEYLPEEYYQSEYDEKMSISRTFLWILLIITLIYGAYHLYNKNLKHTSSTPTKWFNPASIFDKNTFKSK